MNRGPLATEPLRPDAPGRRPALMGRDGPNQPGALLARSEPPAHRGASAMGPAA